MVEIRPMLETDIPAALALWQGLPGIGLREADSPEALSRYLRRNPATSFVARADDGTLVGVSLAGHDGRRGYLHHVAVTLAYRKQGIGRQLVEACISALLAEGIAKINFWVKADNTAGLAFWQRIGGQVRTDIVMVSIISGDSDNA
jgi:ribosomal protein S18 acetylase RimI-like enzyme